MSRAAKTVLLGLAIAAVWATAAPAGAQVTPVPAVQAKPQHTGNKPIRGQFVVMHMLAATIQVHSAKNASDIFTFTYAQAIRSRMDAILQNGGYQFGDKVVIDYLPDQQVALRIIGKPSKPPSP